MKQINIEIAICSLLSIAFLVLAHIAVPFDYPYAFNFDESIELVRLHLLNNNYIFYQEVWSDHPLGLTRIFDFFTDFFTVDLPSARRIVLGLSTANILVFYGLLRVNCSRLISVASVIMTALSFTYIILSGRAVNETPSLVFSLSSILFMSLYSRSESKNNLLFLAASASLFAFSLHIKLSGISALAPLLIIGLSSKRSNERKVFDGLTWIFIALSIYLILNAFFFPFSYYHFFEFHTQASAAFSDSPETLLALLSKVLHADFGYVVLFLASFLYLLKSGDSQYNILAPLAWLVFNLIRFSNVSPVWPTYYIYLMIPSFWIVAIAAEKAKNQKSSLFESIRNSHWFSKIIVISLMIIVCFQTLFNLFKIVTSSHPKRFQDKQLVYIQNLARNYTESPVDSYLEAHKKAGASIITDNPYYIYKYDLDTPPETAILSRKRVVTEDIDGDYIAYILTSQMPDFVYLNRFHDHFMESHILQEVLEEYYDKVSDEESFEGLYIRKI